MDIKIEKKPWYIRYKFYIAGGIAFVTFLVYVIILSAGPRKLRIESENIQIAEVKDDKFMEYVDVEGLIQPILTIKVNTREAGKRRAYHSRGRQFAPERRYNSDPLESGLAA